MADEQEMSRIVSQIVIDAITVSNLLQKTIAEMVSVVGLSSGQQWKMLQLIERGGEISPSLLINHFLVSKQNIAAMIDRLEQEGFVEKRVNPADKRGILLRVTPKGLKANAVLEEVGGEYRERSFHGFSAEEIDSLSELLRKLKTNLFER